MIDPTHSIF